MDRRIFSEDGLGVKVAEFPNKIIDPESEDKFVDRKWKSEDNRRIG